MTLVLTTQTDNQSKSAPTWGDLWLDDVDSREAARIMRCSNDTAKRRLEQAGRRIERHQAHGLDGIEAAASLLRHCGVARAQVLTTRGRLVGRSKWADLALGLITEAAAA
jgi:hypothetical protein